MSAIEQASLPHFTSLPSQPPRRYLFGPGPSMVHPRVYEALSKPIVGHLDPYFIQVMGDVQQLLKTAYGTSDGATLVISGTGSAGMEAAVANFVEPGSKLAVFANGYFSDRLTEMAKRNGANVVRFEKAWGETYTDDEAREFIASREAQGCGLCSCRDIDGSVAIGPRDLCRRARCRRSGDRGLCHLARRSAGRVRPDRYRHRIQLHAKRIELSARLVSDGDVAESDGMAARPHDPVAQLVSGPQADSRLLHGVAPLSSHRADFHVLRLARSAPGHRRGRNREPLGAASPLPSSLSSRASKRWACACTFPKRIELQPSTQCACPKEWTKPKCASIF